MKNSSIFKTVKTRIIVLTTISMLFLSIITGFIQFYNLSAQAEQLKELISVFKIGNLQNKNVIIKQKNKQENEILEHKNKGFNMNLSNKDKSDDDFETF